MASWGGGGEGWLAWLGVGGGSPHPGAEGWLGGELRVGGGGGGGGRGLRWGELRVGLGLQEYLRGLESGFRMLPIVTEAKRQNPDQEGSRPNSSPVILSQKRVNLGLIAREGFSNVSYIKKCALQHTKSLKESD